MSTGVVTMLLLLISGVLCYLGIREKKQNEKNIDQFEIRVNVNGIRGKSTATRLITAILTEAGYRTVGKTTGTAARLIFWDQEEEQIIERKPRGVSLKEQLDVIKKAASSGANALVCECMAVKPEYQRVFQHQMLKAHLTVIVNVLEDHLDEMGPTTRQIAWAFADTIPHHGLCVIPDCEFTDYFLRIAKNRETKAYVVDDSEIKEEYLSQFSYKLFDHNCAVALAAARALGIPDEISFRGMLKAHPDPGALCSHRIGKNAVFVNGFAANEPTSSLEIWESIKSSGYHCDDPIIVMNCRPDRVDRTRQFIRDFFPYIENATLLVIGERTRECVQAYQKGRFKNLKEFHCIEGKELSPIMDYLIPRMENRVILGVGNIHGIGGDFIKAILDMKNTF